MYGGEGGIRTHGRVSPTLAFEASSFNRSDTSPQLYAHSSGAATAGQRPAGWRLPESILPKLVFAWRAHPKWQEGWDALAVGLIAGAESSG
jgi:hypothetical protein